MKNLTSVSGLWFICDTKSKKKNWKRFKEVKKGNGNKYTSLLGVKKTKVFKNSLCILWLQKEYKIFKNQNLEI